MQRLSELAELEADRRSAALVITRLATDDGRRTDLDDAIPRSASTGPSSRPSSTPKSSGTRSRR